MRAAAASMKVLRPGGHWRIAVPDAYFPKYIKVFAWRLFSQVFACIPKYFPDAYFSKYLPVFPIITLTPTCISPIILKYFQLILKYHSAKVISQIFPKYYLMCEYLKLNTHTIKLHL